jgi:WhiB family redox-sensing transcriptional regulator
LLLLFTKINSHLAKRKNKEKPMLELLIETEDEWNVAGRCNDNNGTLTHLFFSDNVAHQARAKAMCSKCPVSEECLDAALTRKELWGIWGGQLIENGRIVIGKRGRGRPPKEPRPVVEVNEVPVPPELIPA